MRVAAGRRTPWRSSPVVDQGVQAPQAAFAMSAVYCATKFAVGAFSEALRQELASRHVRVSVVEPGSVDTELRTHNAAPVQQQLEAYFGDIDRLQSQDVADAVGYIVTRPRHVAVAELLIRPTEQV
ncbi:SDR family NAD(P)-dependent oxidoreductase [Streptomyces echinatus]|uniref:SDR family NAD(P)-dependent oxidoreductase n=1 Tax=Streptomyces echinatus TaxID=67293 RepID=UPI0037FC2E76